LVVASLAKGAKLGQKDQAISAVHPPLLVKIFADFMVEKVQVPRRHKADSVVPKLGLSTA
jgi:hypothetical protein